jgi:hypothetical protein
MKKLETKTPTNMATHPESRIHRQEEDTIPAQPQNDAVAVM